MATAEVVVSMSVACTSSVTDAERTAPVDTVVVSSVPAGVCIHCMTSLEGSAFRTGDSEVAAGLDKAVRVTTGGKALV